MHSLLARQIRKFFGGNLPAELAAFTTAVDDSYVAFDNDVKILHRAMELSSQELTQANIEVRAVIEAIPDVILRLDREGNIVPLKAPEQVADSHAHRFNKRRITGKLSHLPDPAVRVAFERGLKEVLTDGQLKTFEYTVVSELGESFFEVRLVALKNGEAIAIIQDVTQRKQSEAEHERLNRELISASRLAGMAEVATGVLHNVGNVLNSVNLSVSMLAEQLRKSKISSLGRVVQLLNEHREDLGEFLTGDPKGRQLPAFIEVLSAHLTREQSLLVQETHSLQQSIEHIKQIVSVQQAYAKVAGATEVLQVHVLLEEALRMSSAALSRREIEIVREFEPVAPVLADRHLVLQILINLVSNAEQALRGRPDDGRIILRIGRGERDRVRIEVADNGVGISRENLARIFSHGFTTKTNGHGFGLHSGANAAKQIGGSLGVRSDGPGTGATFVLELPPAPETRSSSGSDAIASKVTHGHQALTHLTPS
jgi:two-component system, LuxR family, sensor kinase FixL